MRAVFHYAPWARLPGIAASLRPSNAVAPGEVPLLWFSANQHWEPTTTKMLVSESGHVHSMTFRELLVRLGCIRFGMMANDPRLMPWKAACAAAGTGRDTRRELERVGK